MLLRVLFLFIFPVVCAQATVIEILTPPHAGPLKWTIRDVIDRGSDFHLIETSRTLRAQEGYRIVEIHAELTNKGKEAAFFSLLNCRLSCKRERCDYLPVPDHDQLPGSTLLRTITLRPGDRVTGSMFFQFPINEIPVIFKGDSGNGKEYFEIRNVLRGFERLLSLETSRNNVMNRLNTIQAQGNHEQNLLGPKPYRFESSGEVFLGSKVFLGWYNESDGEVAFKNFILESKTTAV